MKILSSTFISAKNEQHSGNALVWLYRVQLDANPANDLFRANHKRDVLYDPNDGGGVRTWSATSLKIADISEEDESMEDVHVSISNVDRTVTQHISNNAIRNRRVTALLVALNDLAVIGHHDVMTWIVRGVHINEKDATFELNQFPWWAFPFPHDRYVRDQCRFIYEGGTNPTVDGRCAAVNASETCDKSYEGSDGCAGRDNQPRYGAFPNLLVGPHPLL